MLVKLNCYRLDAFPGDIVDLPDADAAALIHHGAAFPTEDFDDGPAAEATESGRTVVRAAAALQAASGADASEAPAL